MLAPGDVLWVPERQKEGLPFSPGGTQKYVATVPKVRVDVVLRDEAKVLSNEPYVLEGLQRAVLGTSDGEGKVTIVAPVHTLVLAARGGRVSAVGGRGGEHLGVRAAGYADVAVLLEGAVPRAGE